MQKERPVKSLCLNDSTLMTRPRCGILTETQVLGYVGTVCTTPSWSSSSGKRLTMQARPSL